MALLPNRAALLLAAACCALRGVAHAWTADGYPDCTATQGPSCTPNRRAQHHNSLLNSLFNKYCSDKGTYWLSKHNYGAAYDTVLRPTRRRTRHLVELGVGDETAASLNAWREYFPRADFWIVDVDVARFADEKQWAWASRQKRRHGCYDDKHVWRAPRVHPLFGVDSSNRTMLRELPLPPSVDVIIDDASHAIAHQLAALEALWPRLRDGGFYIVEDLTVGALPWMKGLAGRDQVRRAPSNNSNCGHECHYVQRPAEHPFIKRLIPTLADQQAAREALALGGGVLPRAIERILDSNAWFYSITGAHVGGGLDSTVIIQKTEAGLDAAALDEQGGGSGGGSGGGGGGSGGSGGSSGGSGGSMDADVTVSSAVGGTAAAAAASAAASGAAGVGLPAWTVSATVHTAVPEELGTLSQLLALLLLVGIVATSRGRIVGACRRVAGRSSTSAE